MGHSNVCVGIAFLRIPVSFLHSLSLHGTTFCIKQKGRPKERRKKKEGHHALLFPRRFYRQMIHKFYKKIHKLHKCCVSHVSLIVQIHCKLLRLALCLPFAYPSPYNSTVVFHDKSLFSTIKNSLSCCPQIVVVVFGEHSTRIWVLA